MRFRNDETDIFNISEHIWILFCLDDIRENFYGEVINRSVDNIIIFLFVLIIYIATKHFC